MNILCLFAHPDDLEIWAGGTVAQFIKNGYKVKCCVFYCLDEVRIQECHESSKLLGYEPIFIKTPDFNEIDTNAVFQIVREFNPDLLITHWNHDSHWDHVSVFRVAQKVVYYINRLLKKQIPLWMGNTYFLKGVDKSFEPDILLDITLYEKIKRKAILMHSSQEPEEILNWSMAQDSLLGHKIKSKYAEGFISYPVLGSQQTQTWSELTNNNANNTCSRIFIAGCARSGTTLLQCLFSCFASTSVVQGEHTAAHFVDQNISEKNIVLKRTGKCYTTLAKLPLTISIVYLIRHPLDVLTSNHPEYPNKYYVDIDRWLGEFNALKAMMPNRTEGKDLIFVKYEQLVSQPKEVEQLLCKKLRLSIESEFCEFGNKEFPFYLSTLNDRMQDWLNTYRPLDLSSIERWSSKHCKQRVTYVMNNIANEINEYCSLFGYEKIVI